MGGRVSLSRLIWWQLIKNKHQVAFAHSHIAEKLKTTYQSNCEPLTPMSDQDTISP